MSGPSFRNPPAIERVLSVQFRELAGFDLVHYGMWFERIRDGFPQATREGRLPPIIERFPALPGRHHLKVDVGFPLGRCVYSSPLPSTRLQQVQPDRFAMNWRRSTGDDYLQFSQTSMRFEEMFERFKAFCVDAGLSEPFVELCEVTYVNRIESRPGIDLASYAGQVLGEGILGRTEKWLSVPSAFAMNRRFDFTEQRGRLYAEVTSAEDASGEFLLLKMTGRTVVQAEDSWQDRMTLAHDWVVDGFVAITQEEVRRNVWEQYDG